MRAVDGRRSSCRKLPGRHGALPIAAWRGNRLASICVSGVRTLARVATTPSRQGASTRVPSGPLDTPATPIACQPGWAGPPTVGAGDTQEAPLMIDRRSYDAGYEA